MNHEAIKDSYFLYANGQLDDQQRAEIDLHLSSCEECRQGFSSSDSILKTLEVIATESHKPHPSLSVLIANEIARAPTPSLFSFGRLRWLAFGATTIMVLLFLRPIFTTPTSGGSGGGVSGATFSEAAFDDTLVRSGVGTIIQLLEGAVIGIGSIVCLVFGGVGIFVFRRDPRALSYRLALYSFGLGLSLFLLRVVVEKLFGSES